MALRTFVRVNGINNLSDARYCAGMEVNELGFNIEANHSNYTDPAKFKELSEWLSGVEFVGEICQTDTNIEETIEGYALNAIQIENLGQIEAAFKTGLQVSFIANNISEAKEAWALSGQKLAYVLLGVGNFKSSDIQALALEIPVLLNDGFDDTSLLPLLESCGAKGIVLEGGNEIRPGYKDFDELADILELLEIDDLA